MRQPVHWEAPEERPPLPPALFEALVDAWVQLLLDDLALDEAQAKVAGPMLTVQTVQTDDTAQEVRPPGRSGQRPTGDQTMAKRKGDPEEPQKTSLKLPPGLWREVRAAAILQGKTGNQLVVEALQRIIKESKGGRV